MPQFGAERVQTGPDSAEIRFAGLDRIAPVQVTLDAKGTLTEVWALRWSDANPDKIYRLQPFGGRMLAMVRRGGCLIPARAEPGNMWGTRDHAPFFLASITAVEC